LEQRLAEAEKQKEILEKARVVEEKKKKQL